VVEYVLLQHCNVCAVFYSLRSLCPAVDPEIHQGVLTGHRDAVWDLAIHPTTGLLLSCGADGSCRLWNHTQSSPMVQEFVAEERKLVASVLACLLLGKVN